ncbi:hypothetical protein KSX_96310 [Ktedonospora formicarum]|uniref:Uncharacterized protein n=1 Tax=Ktedonospora formicarum TaxID=2778364 RepID=A0A8J3IFN5_9CHLR|nr:hypothetical protein KSX_96310 [Ktedonospora formicarum]
MLSLMFLNKIEWEPDRVLQDGELSITLSWNETTSVSTSAHSLVAMGTQTTRIPSRPVLSSKTKQKYPLSSPQKSKKGVLYDTELFLTPSCTY